MVIGACENCRYTDLIAGDLDTCPRCGSVIVSLGVDSAQWNKMSYPDRNELIESKFSRKMPDYMTESAPKAEGQPAAPDPKPAPEDKAPSADKPFVEDRTSSEAKAPAQDTAASEPSLFNEKLNEYVYACFNCDSISSYENESGKYFCPECGSDMMWTGFTVYEWGKLSIRAKRNATENSKIRYIESRIKKSDFKSS